MFGSVAGCEETIHAKDASPLVKLTLKASPREDLSIMRVFMLGCVGGHSRQHPCCQHPHPQHAQARVDIHFARVDIRNHDMVGLASRRPLLN